MGVESCRGNLLCHGRLSALVCLLLLAALAAAPGCMNMVPSTKGKPRPREEMHSGRRPASRPAELVSERFVDDGDYADEDFDAAPTRRTASTGGFHRKQKFRPGENRAEQEERRIYEQIIADNSTQMPSSLRADMNYWQREANKAENQIREHEVRVADADETLRQLRLKREEAALKIDLLEELADSIGVPDPGRAPSSRDPAALSMPPSLSGGPEPAVAAAESPLDRLKVSANEFTSGAGPRPAPTPAPAPAGLAAYGQAAGHPGIAALSVPPGQPAHNPLSGAGNSWLTDEPE